MTTAQKRTKRRTGESRHTSGSPAKAVADAAQRAKGPALASGMAVAGLAAGTVLGSKLRAQRRPHVLGLPMPRGSELKSGARQVARAGRWASDMQADVRAVRAQAQQSRRQSPIEVLLSALTSRRLPRHDTNVD
jgi:hypothetical protein